MIKAIILIVTILTVCESSLVPGVNIDSAIESKTPKKCFLERAFKMTGYNCAKIELKDVPKNLKTNVEVNYCLYLLMNQFFTKLDNFKISKRRSVGCSK